MDYGCLYNPWSQEHSEKAETKRSRCDGSPSVHVHVHTLVPRPSPSTCADNELNEGAEKGLVHFAHGTQEIIDL